MNGQVGLITGALSGIGRAAAVAFVKKGAKVAVTGRLDETGKTLVKELRSLGSEAEFIKAESATRLTFAIWSTRPSHNPVTPTWFWRPQTTVAV
jgi:NAD(P)-dependent dehydrogenase (short-subunit alcohol dehydrogenase family)